MPGFLTAVSLCIAVITAIVLSATAKLTTERIPLSSAKDDYKAPAISWVKKTPNAIGEHWGAFNAVATLVSALSGVAVALFSPYGKQIQISTQAYTGSDISICILAIISACTLGFHLVWSSCLDWRFHMIPRWALVTHMFMQLAVTVACLAMSSGYSWLILSVILTSVMCWMLGLPRSSGMSDGRLYVIVAAAVIPFLMMDAWMPLLVVGVGAILNAIVSTVTGGSMLHAERDESENLAVRILRAKSPMGPFVATSFYVFFMLAVFQILPSVTPLL